MNSARVDLAANNVVATGKKWPGGRGIFIAEGTWGGGTAKLQIKSPNGTWVDVDGASLSANGTKMFDCCPGEIQVAIATATAVYAYAVTIV